MFNASSIRPLLRDVSYSAAIAVMITSLSLLFTGAVSEYLREPGKQIHMFVQAYYMFIGYSDSNWVVVPAEYKTVSNLMFWFLFVLAVIRIGRAMIGLRG